MRCFTCLVVCALLCCCRGTLTPNRSVMALHGKFGECTQIIFGRLSCSSNTLVQRCCPSASRHPFVGLNVVLFYVLIIGQLASGLETFVGPLGHNGDAFGSAISRDATTMAVAAHLASNGAGKVHLFTENEQGLWQETGSLQPSYLLPGDAFGASLVLQNGLLLVGAPGDSKYQGTLYIFRGSSGALWSRIGQLRASDASPGDRFGSSAALSPSGGVLAVGAPQSGGTGAVYIFQPQGSPGQFAQQSKISPSIALLSFFGSSVAVTYERLLVGAPFGVINGTRSGAVYYYRREDINWEQQQVLTSSGDPPCIIVHQYVGTSKL